MEVLDASEHPSPVPLLMARKRLDGMAPGALLRVVCSHAQSVVEFQAFARYTYHEIIEQMEEGGKFVHILKRSGTPLLELGESPTKPVRPGEPDSDTQWVD